MNISGKGLPENMVILDTNFIIYSVSNRINIVDTVNQALPGAIPAVTDSVLSELRGLSRFKSEAAVGLELVRNFPIVPSSKPGDEGILEASIQMKLPVITNDLKLSKLLIMNHIRVYSLRDRRYLEARR